MGVIKVGAKLAISFVSGPMVCLVELSDAAYCLRNGDKLGAGICTVFAVADFFTYGATSLVYKGAANIAETLAKDASIQATKGMAR